MSGLVYLRSLMDGIEMGTVNGPMILLILGMIFIVVDAVYLGRVIRARMNNKRALRSNVVHQFHRHVIIDHLEYKDMTKDQLADKMQISPRQLDLASKRATGLPAMKVVSIVRSEYGVHE